MRRSLLLLFACIAAGTLFAQLSTNPVYIGKDYNGSFSVTFNPQLGNGGMKNSVDCYAHVGVLTNLSADDTDWRYATTWGSTDKRMTRNSDGTFTLQIFPDIYTYFGCPRTEEIQKIAFVFHDTQSGGHEGKTWWNGDIILPLRTADEFWPSTDPLTDKQQARPAGLQMGITYNPSDQSEVTLCTFAATNKWTNHPDVLIPAQAVYVVGDFNNWQILPAYQMNRDGNYFWLTLTGLTPQQPYAFQYVVIRADGAVRRISDMFSEELLCTWDHVANAPSYPALVNPTLPAYPSQAAEGYVTVLQTGKQPFPWSQQTLNFTRPDKNNLVICEIWPYDYTPQRSFEGIRSRLPYLHDLGVNCIELMPVNEFDYNYSWGYSPNHYFSIDRNYGSSDDFKRLVDDCHKQGIAVIIDMVFNHATCFNPMERILSDENGELPWNPWFNTYAPHNCSVYSDFNHDFSPVREHFARVLPYWLREYKIDGYRMDISYGYCGHGCQNMLSYLDLYYDSLQAASPGAYYTHEYWTDSPSPDQLVQRGWLCWRNGDLQHAYMQTAMGALEDRDDLSGANADGYVTYCDNHDEERPFFKAKMWGQNNIATDFNVRMNRIPLNMAFLVLLNGPQLFYQFAEVGYDRSKYQDKDGNWSTGNPYSFPATTEGLAELVKMEVKARPEEMGYFDAGPRMEAFQRVAQIIQLRTRLLPSVFAGDPTEAHLGAGYWTRIIRWGNNVIAVGNFTAYNEQYYTLPSGTWYDYLAGGTKATAGTVYTLQPGELKIFTGTQVVPPSVPASYSFLPTDLDETDGVEKAADVRKRLINGSLFILRDGVEYDVLGRRVRF